MVKTEASLSATDGELRGHRRPGTYLAYFTYLTVKASSILEYFGVDAVADSATARFCFPREEYM